MPLLSHLIMFLHVSFSYWKKPKYQPRFGSKYHVTYLLIPFPRNSKPRTYLPWYYDFKYLINTLLVGYYFLKNQYPINTLMGTYHLIWVCYLIFIKKIHPRTFIHLRFHITYLTLNHKSFFHVSLLALHSTMFFYLLLGWIVVFGYNNHQTWQLVLIVVMVIYEILECYCECWGRISRCYWGFTMENFPFNSQ